MLGNTQESTQVSTGIRKRECRDHCGAGCTTPNHASPVTQKDLYMHTWPSTGYTLLQCSCSVAALVYPSSSWTACSGPGLLFWGHVLKTRARHSDVRIQPHACIRSGLAGVSTCPTRRMPPDSMPTAATCASHQDDREAALVACHTHIGPCASLRLPGTCAVDSSSVTRTSFVQGASYLLRGG